MDTAIRLSLLSRSGIPLFFHENVVLPKHYRLLPYMVDKTSLVFLLGAFSSVYVFRNFLVEEQRLE